MKKKDEKEEYLKHIWHMKEQHEDRLDYLFNVIGFHPNHTSIIQEMLIEDLILVENQKVFLTPNGEEQALRIIRCHRLAERLIYDVLGSDYEDGACEFEHIVNNELVDSICILLGHPRECPHGRIIPKGECCKRALKVAECAVMPLTELAIHRASRIAYVNGHQDARLNKLDALQIRPGVMITMEQKSPTLVVQCEGSDIALDTNVADNIYVWKESPKYQASNNQGIFLPEKKCRKRHLWNGFMRRKSNQNF
nr:magnetosome protein Mad30 [Desulfobacteraceae bacterium]